MRRAEVITNQIQAGDVVVGLASAGQTTYETAYNGGMGSNGLTSARHDVLGHDYATRYPETYDPATPARLVYSGKRQLTETVQIAGQEIPIGKLILSPTRTYLPFIKPLLDQLRPQIHGMIHCTGGGQTKVIKFLDHKKVVKNNLLPTPPLFQLIQAESNATWKEMYQVFNMGQRLELYLPAAYAQQVIDLAQSFNIEAQVVGHVEENAFNQVCIHSPYGSFEYQ
jgi:phosphoribosylformylglycinamidine cyclo-ligase